MCHDGPIENFCFQPTDFYLCKCLFDKIVKIKFSLLRYHEEIVISLTNQSWHLYLALVFLCERAVLCRSCASAFRIMVDGKKICFHYKMELNIHDIISI